MINRNWLVEAIQKGLIGGVVAVLVSLIGMVMRFSVRPIIEGVTDLGHALLFAIFFIFAYQAAKAEYPAVQRLLSGVIVGAITASFLVLLVLLGGQINLRVMFINASPELYEFLALGNLALVPVIGAVCGLIAAIFHFFTARLRSPSYSA